MNMRFEVQVIRLEIIHSTVAVRNVVVFSKSLLLPVVHTVKYALHNVSMPISNPEFEAGDEVITAKSSLSIRLCLRAKR